MSHARDVKNAESWKTDPRWQGVRAALQRRGRRPAGAAAVRVEHTLARLGAERLWELLRRARTTCRRSARMTGNQAIQQVQAGLKAIYLQRLAGGGRRQRGRRDVSRPEPLPRQQRADAGAAHQQRPAPGRPDPARRGRARAADWFAPIVADAEAGFGGNLNAFELMKAMIEAGAAGVHFEDQLSSAKKCGHMGGKVLVPTSGVRAEADRGAAGGRRPRRAHAPDRPHRRQQRQADHQRRRPARPRVPRPRERTAEGFFRLRRRHRRGHRPRPLLRPLRRPALVRDLEARTSRRRGGSPRPSTPSSRASCWPTTARRRSTGSRSSTPRPSPASSASSAPWATSSSSSPWPASTR